MNKFIKYALIRAVKTTCQELATTIPAGVIVTPVMVQHFDISFLYVAVAWLLTGILGGLASLLTSVATGLPEVKYEQHLYGQADEPVDSELEESEVEDENE